MNKVSDPALLREWIASVNGRAADKASVHRPQRAALPRRLEAPSYYAEDAQILMHGDSAMLLFTRPHPAVMPDRNIAPTPLREPVTTIGMNVQALADLSNTIDAAIQQIEEQDSETNTNSVHERDANHPAKPKDCEKAASSPLASSGQSGVRRPRLGIGGKLIPILSFISRGAAKITALLGGVGLITMLWYWDASLLTVAADENLRVLNVVIKLLSLDWASKVENALRTFGADGALVLIEAVAATKLIMFSIALPFRRLRFSVRAARQV